MFNNSGGPSTLYFQPTSFMYNAYCLTRTRSCIIRKIEEGTAMSKKMKRSAEEESSSSKHSTSSTDDDMSMEETTPPRRRSKSRRNTRKREDKVIIMLSELQKEMRKQSKQLTGSKDETSEMRKQLKKLTESHNDQSKKLEKLTESLNDLCKQMELHTNGKNGDDSAAPRSQLNQVHPPRYRLVFTSGEIDRIEKGKIVEISVALVDGNNGQTVENGPLASATVELVVVNAEFNQHDNEYNWSREDFERNIIKKARQGNSAMGDVDQSVKSIVSNGRFNLVHGAKRHSGSTIFINSSNKKVRLGLMVVSPMEARVLEGLSNPFFVRGHDRPARQNNVRHNRSNTQRQALADNGCQEQNGPIPNIQNQSWPNPTTAGGMRLNTTGGQPQLPFVEYTTVPSSGLNITGGQPQLSVIGNTTIPSIDSSTGLDQHALIQQYHNRDWSMLVQATNNQTGTQFNTSQIALPVHLIWDRPNVEPSKHHWDLLEKLMPRYKFSRCGLPMHLMQEHFGSLTVIPKEVMQTRWKNAFIEPLEPDDSDEERPLKRKLHNKYRLLFVNKVCKAYYTWDQIKADDGSLVMVALYDENNIKITSGPLSSASVEVVALHGDFNFNASQDYWTSEEFNDSIACPAPGEEASSVSVLGGDRILVLADGEACLSDAFFKRTSICARTGMFKMGVMLANAQDERVQEGISEPFRVIDNRVKELNAKDGPTQGFNPDAAIVQFPRNAVTEAIKQHASIPHQISPLKTRSAPCMSILSAAQHTAAMAALGVLEARTTTIALRPTEVVAASRPPSPVIRRAYMSHKLHLAPMPVPSIPSCCSFLQRCFLCQRELTDGMDIYMYRGDRAFCSESCRSRHMEDDNPAIDSGRVKAPDRFRRSGSCYKATHSVCFFLEGRQVQG